MVSLWRLGSGPVPGDPLGKQAGREAASVSAPEKKAAKEGHGFKSSSILHKRGSVKNHSLKRINSSNCVVSYFLHTRMHGF